MIEFIRPTSEAIEFIAANMREGDVREVWASDRMTPLAALEMSVEVSNYSAVVLIEEKPAVILGVNIISLIGGVGVPWMLSTDGVTKQRRDVLNASREGVQEMLEICSFLVNHVHTENKTSIRWLKWLGFIIEDPLPLPTTGELFHRFHMEKSHV